MKKIIFMIVAMFSMCLATVNAQEIRLSGNVGATLAVEPHNDNLISFPETVNLGIGAMWDNYIYTGIGIAPGVFTEHYHVGCDWTSDHSNFIMPFYFQASYVAPDSWYADVKLGGEWVNYEGENATFAFISVTPIGWTFGEHNSVGLGWRYHAKNEFKGHSIALTYQYTF